MSISDSRFSISDPIETFNSGDLFSLGSDVYNGYTSPGTSGDGLYGGLSSLGSDTASKMSSILSGGSGSGLGDMFSGTGLAGAARDYLDPSGVLDSVFGTKYDFKSAFGQLSDACLRDLFRGCESDRKYTKRKGYRRVYDAECNMEAFLALLGQLSGGSYTGSSFDLCALTSLIEGAVTKALKMGLDGVYSLMDGVLGSPVASIAAGLLLAEDGAEEGDSRKLEEIAGNGYASSVGAVAGDLPSKIAKGYKKAKDDEETGTAERADKLTDTLDAFDPKWKEDDTGTPTTSKIDGASSDFVDTLGGKTSKPAVAGDTSISDTDAIYAVAKSEDKSCAGEDC
jgi:hypothetical protein